jgi:hypothetical protein
VNRKTLVITVVSGIIAMAFAGVALSRGGSDAPAADPAHAGEAWRKASGSEEKTHPSPRVDGQTWGMRSYTSVRGELCLSNDVPGEAVGTGCIARERLFADGPVFAIRGARQESGSQAKQDWDNQWVYGFAHPSIKELALLNMDCSTVRLSLDDDGAFKHVVSRAEIQAGQVPFKLIGRGLAGQVLAEKDVSIGLTRNADKAGLGAPRPKQVCS